MKTYTSILSEYEDMTVVYVQPTGTGSLLALNVSSPTGSPIAFVGAAALAKPAAAGASLMAFFAGAGVFFNL